MNSRRLVGCAIALLLCLPAARASSDSPPETRAGSAAAGRVEAGGRERAGVAPKVGQHGVYAATFARTPTSFLLVHYWSKGALFRSETIVSGHPIVTIVNDAQYYTIDPLAGVGVAIRRGEEVVAADAGRDRLFGDELAEVLAAGGEKVRDDRIRGVPVEVYRVTDDRGRRVVWVEQDASRLPLRVETFDRKSGRSTQTDYVDWRSGLEIPDSFFQPPSAIEMRLFDSYEQYVEALARGPVPPAPPLFQHLLRGRR